MDFYNFYLFVYISGLVRSSYPNGLTSSRPTLPKNWLHMMRIGTTPDWHPWPDTFTLGLPSVFPQFARCMEVKKNSIYLVKGGSSLDFN